MLKISMKNLIVTGCIISLILSCVEKNDTKDEINIEMVPQSNEPIRVLDFELSPRPPNKTKICAALNNPDSNLAKQFIHLIPELCLGTNEDINCSGLDYQECDANPYCFKAVADETPYCSRVPSDFLFYGVENFEPCVQSGGEWNKIEPTKAGSCLCPGSLLDSLNSQIAKPYYIFGSYYLVEDRGCVSSRDFCEELNGSWQEGDSPEQQSGFWDPNPRCYIDNMEIKVWEEMHRIGIYVSREDYIDFIDHWKTRTFYKFEPVESENSP